MANSELEDGHSGSGCAPGGQAFGSVNFVWMDADATFVARVITEGSAARTMNLCTSRHLPVKFLIPEGMSRRGAGARAAVGLRPA